MRYLNILTLLFVFITATNVPAQTCESIFNTSVLSRFTTEDQEALTTLARRQVELSFNYSISKAQKDAALNHLAEQLEIFIADSRLTTQQERILRQKYRALVFQFKKELTGEMDSETRIAAEKQKALDQQMSLVILKNLMEKYGVDHPNELPHAIVQSNFNTERIDDLKLALSIRGIDVNLKNKSGDTAFYVALESYLNNAEIDAISSAKLISSHPSFNASSKNRWGQAPLHLSHSNPELVSLLIAKGADINARDNNGNTPLHWAIQRQEMEVTLQSIVLLINGSTDINAKNNFGHTALHLAVLFQSVNAVEILLNAKGIDVNIKNKRNRTPLYVAATADTTVANNKIIKLLESQGAIQ